MFKCQIPNGLRKGLCAKLSHKKSQTPSIGIWDFEILEFKKSLFHNIRTRHIKIFINF